MNNILAALQAMDVSTLTYQEWVTVGMGLHVEGFDCSVWEEWSRNDTRYRPGECERKWKTFRNVDIPVRAGTIISMAKEHGYVPKFEDGVMDWSDSISEDGDGFTAYITPKTKEPSRQLITYLETLFDKDDFIGYVTNDVWQDADGKWIPAKGVFNRTAGELIQSLKKHGDDIGATFGDWKKEVGAWIRFNPVDGEGVKNENITKFKYALVESDKMRIADQDAMYRKLELPIACLVHSGGKSLHAIVKVDADDYNEYRKRVEFLYDFLEKNGVAIDKQNRNPSRLSRMPGVDRNGNQQYLVDTNIGRKSWVDWMDFVEGVTDELPDPVNLIDYKDNLPKLPDELIEGVLRCGHKMLISGSSKAGKSFLLMELCAALASGEKWLGFNCKQSKVMYVNLEIDPASCIMRFMSIYDALGIDKSSMKNIIVWNLRGNAVPLNKLVPKLIRRVRDQHFDAVIIDPIYKVITGDENNASDMAEFCNQFDKICAETGCAAIYCHHHSKGVQGAKKAMDRASGSGVFARDPDAQLDMIQLELADEQKGNLKAKNVTAWRLESSLREFENIEPVNFWFSYPVHQLDDTGTLGGAFTEGSFEAVRAKNRKCTTKAERRESVEKAYEACAIKGKVTVSDMAEYAGVTERCVRDRLKEFKHEFSSKNGVVEMLKKAKTEN